ncbi:MAG: hypothetical protein LAP38_14255 [Acidobacteriia bacterium]|nr:hypothetical protein [Terriglobia bacterium]
MPTWTKRLRRAARFLIRHAVSILIPACHLLAGTINVGTVTLTVSGGNSDSSAGPAYVTNPSAFSFIIADGISMVGGQQRRNTDPTGGPNIALDAVRTFDGRQVTISGSIRTLTIADVQGNAGGHSQAFAIGLCTGGWRDQAGATYNLNLFATQASPTSDGFAGIAFGFKNGSLYLTGYDYDTQPNQLFLDLGQVGLASGPSLVTPLNFTLSYNANSLAVTLNGQPLGSIPTSHDFSKALLVAMGASVDPANAAGAMSLSNLTATTPGTPGSPAVIFGVSGDQQIAPVGADPPQPLAVGVVDALRNPLNQITVGFAASNASVAPATVFTDSSGHAFTRATLGSTPGDATITASVVGLPVVTFHLTATAGPVLPNVTSVVNGASFLPGIAAGSWATILGTNLAGATDTAGTSSGSLPTALDNTSVTINGQPAYIYYVSPTQLNVIVPDDPTIGGLSLQVRGPNGAGNIFTAPTQSFAPALFLFTPRYPSAVHGDGTYVGPPNLLSGIATLPAKPKEVIMLFGTGFGPSDPFVPAGKLVTSAQPVAQPVTATVGGQSADVQSYLVFPGLYQFNVTVPDLPDGDAALSLSIVGSRTQDGLLLSIAK